MFRADGQWQSRARAVSFLPLAPVYAPIQFAPASWTVNTRLALRHIAVAGGEAEIALWARNLTDNDDIAFPIVFGRPPFLGSTTYQAARTFGVDLIYNY